MHKPHRFALGLTVAARHRFRAAPTRGKIERYTGNAHEYTRWSVGWPRFLLKESTLNRPVSEEEDGSALEDRYSAKNHAPCMDVAIGRRPGRFSLDRVPARDIFGLTHLRDRICPARSGRSSRLRVTPPSADASSVPKFPWKGTLIFCRLPAWKAQPPLLPILTCFRMVRRRLH